MTKHTRIVVTGLGVVSCFGDDVDHFYQQLLRGKSGISTISGFSTEDLATKFAGEIRDFDPSDYMDKKQARRVDKCISYAIVAAKRALKSSGLEEEALKNLDLEKCGTIIGSGMGGMGVFVDGVHTLKERGAKRVSPFFIPYILTNMGGALFAIDLGFMGPNYSISTACATGNHSIISAANHIRLGDADLMVCGGVEAAIMPMGIAGFNACKALSLRNEEPEKASRPWDKDRDGFVMGEGAGVLVLEKLEHALQRGAPIIAEYLGHGISCDAHHMTEPRADGRGVAKCIFRALDDAGLQPKDINYINAHATSTPAGDMVEVSVLKQVFSEPSSIVMNATKSMIGHSLGAAAGIEAVVLAKAIQEGRVHPTINLDNPEPDLGFQTPTQAMDLDIEFALSNSFGFGGHNGAIIFGKYKG